jgi:hypothetical protein
MLHFILCLHHLIDSVLNNSTGSTLPQNEATPHGSEHIGETGDSWHTFHVIIFHIFSALVKLNVRTHMVSNTLGLQSNLHKFYAVRKE